MSLTTRTKRQFIPDRTQPVAEYVWSSPSQPQRRVHGALVFLFSAALIAAVGMLYLLQTNHVANLGYEMSRLQEERQAALIEQQQLSAQIAEKQALTSIEAIARDDLGMEATGEYAFLDVTLPTPAPVPEPAVEPSGSSAVERFWQRLSGTSEQSSDSGDSR